MSALSHPASRTEVLLRDYPSVAAQGFSPVSAAGPFLAPQSRMWHPRPGRLRSFDYRGLHRYFLTACTACRSPALADGHVVTHCLLLLRQHALEQAFAIPAYCFMPDHLHLVVEGTSEDGDLRRFMNRFKQD